MNIESFSLGKVPPQAQDLEKAVLGAILIQQNALNEVLDVGLQPEMFYNNEHEEIFRTLLEMERESKVIDVLTVCEYLHKTEKLAKVGDAFYITKLTNIVVSTANIEEHCRIILQKHIQRELIKVGIILFQEGFAESTDAFELLEKAEQLLMNTNKDFNKNSYYKAIDLAFKSQVELEKLMSREIKLTGVPTGFRSMDGLTNGWQDEDLIIIAARPSVGKTALALNLAINACTSNIKPTAVGLFSLEMSAIQITKRCISTIAELDLDKIMSGRMNPLDYAQYQEGNAKFSKLKLVIDDTAAITLQNLRSKARKMVGKEKVGLIIIDYLQLMTGDSKKNTNREQEISSISRGLKALAKELHIPIIALSQLSRSIETRANKEPMLSDLRESGAIEQDADIVAFPYREDYGISQKDADPSMKNEASIKFAKHRNGDLETLRFNTNLRIQKWSENIF